MDAKKKTSRMEGKPAEPQPAATDSQEAKRRPIHTIRIEDVSASVWQRDHLVRGQQRTYYSITIERSYRDSTGQYRYTRTFDADSLGQLVTVIQRAAEHIHGLQHPEPEAQV
jgi:hypothetical protein